MLEPFFSICYHWCKQLEHVSLEDRASIQKAIANFEIGFDFADALYHASYKDCTSIASFDEKIFARRTKSTGIIPAVLVPK